MSVSGISDSSVSSLSQELLAGIRGSGSRPQDDEFASSLIKEKDSDGDGLLSLEEVGIDDEHFNSADTDGDGLLSEEEIQADMEQRREQMRMMGELGMLMKGMSTEDLANSILGENDEDGDGSLSLEETGLSEELFSALDSDGDGQISTAELEEALQPMADIGAGAPPPSSQAGGSGQSSSGVSGSEDEEYDEYDLNQDGTVSMDELRQAFLNGDMSLGYIFDEPGDSGFGQSLLMRLAMNAYQAQGGQSSSEEQLAAV